MSGVQLLRLVLLILLHSGLHCRPDPEQAVVDCEAAEYSRTADWEKAVWVAALRPDRPGRALALLDIQARLDTRLSQLFTARLCCPREAMVVKQRYRCGSSLPCSHCTVIDRPLTERCIQLDTPACLQQLVVALQHRKQELLELQLDKLSNASLV